MVKINMKKKIPRWRRNDRCY